jgi:hypothetical protein
LYSASRNSCFTEEETMSGFMLGPEYGSAHPNDWIGAVPTWKAGVFPVPHESPGAPVDRCLLLVTAAGDVVHDAIAPLPPEPELFRLIADGVREVAREARSFPPRLLVVDPSVVEALGEELAPYGVNVHFSPTSRELERAARCMLEYERRARLYSQLQPVVQWTESPVSPEGVGALFAAAARYWRARAWERLQRAPGLLVTCGPVEWIVVPEAPGEGGIGATVFTDLNDFPDELGPWLDGAKGHVFGIRFCPAEELSPRIRREVASEGWEVADAGAYPLVAAGGLPGPKMTELAAYHLSVMLEAAAALAESDRRIRVGTRLTVREGVSVQVLNRRGW